MTAEKWGRTLDAVGKSTVRVMDMGEGHIALTLYGAGNTVLLTVHQSAEVRQALEEAERKTKEETNV